MILNRSRNDIEKSSHVMERDHTLRALRQKVVEIYVRSSNRFDVILLETTPNRATFVHHPFQHRGKARNSSIHFHVDI